jgi:hypothetical protein
VTVDLVDGRSITAPLAWYPRLTHGTDPERQNWRLIGAGEGIHWPDLDEDLSVEDLLAGYSSRESQVSLEKWLRSRQKANTKDNLLRKRSLQDETGAGVDDLEAEGMRALAEAS